MITQFSVKNYKCIRDLVTLDMQALNVSEHSDSLLRDCNNNEILPVSVIYGPNSSGKSTVLDAIGFLNGKIMQPIYSANNKQQQIYDIPCISFKLDEISKTKPSEFNIIFSTDKAEYDYEVKILINKIIHEKLDMTSKKKERITTNTLFERNANIIECKNEFKDIKIDGEISSDLSVLSFIKILYGNNEIIKDIINEFDKMMYINFGLPRDENFTQYFAFNKYRESENNVEIKNKFIGMMNEMDINIFDYHIQEYNEPIKSYKLYTIHKLNDKEYELFASEESSGTQKILTIVPFINFVLYNGGTLIVDELDAKIHPMILKYIINLFTDKKINKKQAQLIFTSHDMTTMDKDVFRRDEIWFTAQNDEQATSLYSLVEFKDSDGKQVRKDASFNKQYLEGKYGADPYLKKIINWEKD